MGFVLNAVLLAACFWAGGALAAGGGVLALGPWVQAAPPNAKVLAAYLVLKNDGDQAQSLVAVSSPNFESVEIHKTVLRGDLAQMESAKELILPAGGTIELKPGGWHLMLIGPKKRFQLGDTIALRLQLKDGKTLLLNAPVRAAAAAQASGHDHAGHAQHAH